MASTLEYLDNDATQQTCLFIRMIDKFFDCLNAQRSTDGQVKTLPLIQEHPTSDSG